MRVESEKMDTETEKMGLDHSLSIVEYSRTKLEEEIIALNRDKAEIQESLSQVCMA